MARQDIDTIDALMARYVAGTLPEPARVLVDAHLTFHAGSRALVAGLEAMAGRSLDAMAPVAIDNRDAMLSRIHATPASVDAAVSRHAGVNDGEAAMPDRLRAFVGCALEDVPWRTKMPGFREYDIGEVDGCHASLFWIRPGRAVPAHTHQGCEISLVLQGAFSDGRGRYGPGDICVADDDVDHRPVAENDRPCIGFAVTDAPLRLTGSFRQLIGDLIG